MLKRPIQGLYEKPDSNEKRNDLGSNCSSKSFFIVDGVFFLSNDGEKKITSRTHDSDVADKLNSHSSELTNYMLLK